MPSSGHPRIAILGAGCIGLSLAWRLATRGAAVTVYDPTPGLGASYAAGGMLAPACESHFHLDRELAIGLAACALWSPYAAELEAASERPVGHHAAGSMLIGFDHDDAAAVQRLADHIASLGLEVEHLTSREARRLAPALAPGIRTGYRVPGDHSVDNRLYLNALVEAARRAGVTLVERAATVRVSEGALTGVTTHAKDTPTGYDAVIVAAGHTSRDALGEAGAGDDPLVPCPVFGVTGEILRFNGGADLLPCTIRGTVRRDPVYLIPRRDGLVLGATQDEARHDTAVTARGLHTLLRGALELMPEIGELTVLDAIARERPGTPDHLPLVGATAVPGLFLATGNFRNGILHAPWVTDALTELVLSGQRDPLLDYADPTRFAADAAPTLETTHG